MDLTGATFDRLTVIGRAPDEPRFHGGAGWHCRCDCGVTLNVPAASLRCGDTRSCGCRKLEIATARLSTHRQTGTPEYRAWQAMKARCGRPQIHNYARYGGRGIVVCARWVNDFAAFIEDMGSRPSDGHSLDRIDNDGPYAPDNCRWATAGQQQRNRRDNVLVTHRGETRTVSEWERLVGLPVGCLKQRLGRLKWPIERAMTEPVKVGRHRPTSSPV